MSETPKPPPISLDAFIEQCWCCKCDEAAEAAHELAALRADRDSLAMAADEAVYEADRLRAERDRLRQALEMAREYVPAVFVAWHEAVQQELAK